MSITFLEENDQTRVRREHLEALRELVGNVYPNKFERSQVVELGSEDTISSIVEKFHSFEPATKDDERPAPEAIELANEQLNRIIVRVAGRIASPPRVMGKAAFAHLSDGASRLQIYVRRADVKAVNNASRTVMEDEAKGWELFQLLDHGDFIGVEGYLFITKTGELSVHATTIQFLSKALLPLPDKMHGIHDPEIRQRQRYADLIAGSLKLEHDEELTPRQVFERRAAVLGELRRILDDHGYIEVETPMLSPLATGAAARPFATWHNALSIPLYARIAPELYLKRLLVGGFEKVYELNRNFRNEGIDRTHNPEFTMLEFYWAYADVNQMMDFCEEMLRATVYKVLGHTHVRYGQLDIDFAAPFERLTMREAVVKYGGVDADRVAALDGIELAEVFGESVEQHLIQPTLITDFPKQISPLSKASPENPQVAERFELFINRMECANGFSELNDPAEQHQRFLEQVLQREEGDEEAMVMDEDYIRALSYGMPPAAGIGIGIDRFVMLLTNRPSIRDVILFPHMRPERKHDEAVEPENETARSVPPDGA